MEFALHLASHLKQPLADVLDMPSEHFGLWIDYHLKHPIDGSREDLRHGILCRLIAAAFAGEKSDPLDWVPMWVEPVVTNNVEDFKAALMGLVGK